MLNSIILYGLVIGLSCGLSQVFECFNASDNGASYLGKVTRQDCITWKEANSPYAEYYEDHKYCRNLFPDQISKPFCYTGPNSAFKLCDDVKTCGTDCVTEPTEGKTNCDVLVTCKPPEPSPGLSWNPDRTLFYNGDKLEFQCSEARHLPSVLSTTCLSNGQLEHSDVKCTSAVFECFSASDNGASYLGKVTRPDCITWQEANSPYAKYYEDHKYCRNPLPDQMSKPYCYTGPNSAFKVCDDVKKCGTDCATKPTEGKTDCEVLVTCQPPGTETYPDVIWSINRALYYADEKIYFECRDKGHFPSVNSFTCLQNGTFEQLAIKCEDGRTDVKQTEPVLVTTVFPDRKYYNPHQHINSHSSDNFCQVIHNSLSTGRYVRQTLMTLYHRTSKRKIAKSIIFA